MCRLLPCPRGLPQTRDGSASASHLSRPAQTSLALRPDGSLNRPRRPLSRGSNPTGYPVKSLVSYQINRQLSGWNLPPLMIHAFGAHPSFPHSSRSGWRPLLRQPVGAGSFQARAGRRHGGGRIKPAERTNSFGSRAPQTSSASLPGRFSAGPSLNRRRRERMEDMGSERPERREGRVDGTVMAATIHCGQSAMVETCQTCARAGKHGRCGLSDVARSGAPCPGTRVDRWL